MANKTLICFDASIRDGKVGIGIWDSTNNRKVFKTFGMPYKNFQSDEAERMGLIATLQYIQEFNITQAHLFTDNQNVYNEGINKKLLRKYTKKMSYVELFWLPRQFNQEADLLSKKGSEVNKVAINTLVQQNIDKSSAATGTGLNLRIKSFTLTQRFKLFRRIATSEFQMNFCNMIENPKTGVLDKAKDTEDNRFVRFVFACVKSTECSNLDVFRKHFNKRPCLSNKQIEKLIREKELI